MTGEYIEELIGKLSKTQSKMLYLQKADAKMELQKWYREVSQKFELLIEMYQSAVRVETKKFLLKNQCSLILNNMAEQSRQLDRLQDMSEVEIIRLFEQQFKLKKIIRKFAQ